MLPDWEAAIATRNDCPISHGRLFGGIAGGWQRVQAICDYVHERIEFGYHHAPLRPHGFRRP